jgi:hypothetical protein
VEAVVTTLMKLVVVVAVEAATALVKVGAVAWARKARPWSNAR